MTESTPKLTVGELTDPMCPTCNVAMYGVSAMILGKDKKFKHYAQCPQCNFNTKTLKKEKRTCG